MEQTLKEESARFLDAWMKVRQMVQAANFNRFHQAGVSATQFMALNVIPADGLTLSAMAKLLNLSAATLNETVNSLEERGLVQRRRNERDARKVDIRATAAGEELQNAVSREFHGYIEEIFLRMRSARRQGLLAGLEEMVQLGGAEEATRRGGDAPPARRSSRRSPGR